MEHPEAYQSECTKRLGVSIQGIIHALRHLGVTYKKLCHSRAREKERYIFQRKIEGYEREGRVIVYFDESGFAHGMPRTHGYAPVNERCYGVKDRHARSRTNVIGALIQKMLLTVGVFSQYQHRHLSAWVTQDLLPKLLPAA